MKEEYKKLLRELADLNNESNEADVIREEMDPIWYLLTQEEKAEMRKYSADLYETDS